MQKRWIVTVLMPLLFFFATQMASAAVVREGSRGPEVQHVQELLIAHGYLEDAADGVAGEKTVAAIRRFQQAAGLAVDGVCGEGTLRALTGGRGAVFVEEYAIAPERMGSGRALFVSATAYSAFDPGNTDRTASGTRVRRGVIAVDPAVIPLGTRVFIPGYGEAVAEDTGGAILGNHIDVAFDTREDALAFGRKSFEIYVLE